MSCWLTLALCGAAVISIPKGDPGAPPGPQSSRLKIQPFLGVPEERVQKTEDEYTKIDPRLRGIVTMTEVRLADYASYLKFKKERRVSKEERRDGFVYFAVREGMHVPFPAPAGA